MIKKMHKIDLLGIISVLTIFLTSSFMFFTLGTIKRLEGRVEKLEREVNQHANVIFLFDQMMRVAPRVPLEHQEILRMEIPKIYIPNTEKEEGFLPFYVVEEEV